MSQLPPSDQWLQNFYQAWAGMFQPGIQPPLPPEPRNLTPPPPPPPPSLPLQRPPLLPFPPGNNDFAATTSGCRNVCPGQPQPPPLPPLQRPPPFPPGNNNFAGTTSGHRNVNPGQPQSSQGIASFFNTRPFSNKPAPARHTSAPNGPTTAPSTARQRQWNASSPLRPPMLSRGDVGVQSPPLARNLSQPVPSPNPSRPSNISTPSNFSFRAPTHMQPVRAQVQTQQTRAAPNPVQSVTYWSLTDVTILPEQFADFFSINDDGTTYINREILSQSQGQSTEKSQKKAAAKHSDTGSKGTEVKEKPNKKSKRTSLEVSPYLPFDEIIGYQLPEEACGALEVLFSGRTEPKPNYILTKYRRAEIRLSTGEVFEALGETDEEAQGKAAADALRFLKKLQ